MPREKTGKKVASEAGKLLQLSDTELWLKAHGRRILKSHDPEDARKAARSKAWKAFCKVCRAGWASLLTQTEK